MSKKETAIAATTASRDPFALLRETTAELKRAIDRPFGGFRWPALRSLQASGSTWAPEIDMFERDHQPTTSGWKALAEQ